MNKNSEVCVDIILATHNGGKYIKEQIISILNQTHTNLRLIISDDGSVDETISIVNCFIAEDKRVSLVFDNEKKGIISNFNNGLKYVSSSYIMFCDQDDVWKSEKIEYSLDFILKEEKNVKGESLPCLIFSDLSIVDQELNNISSSFYKYNSLDPLNNLDIRYLRWRSSVYGCTVIFNRILLEKSGFVPIGFSMHDHWYAYHAAKYGKICYTDKSHILYRQHNNNAVGAHGRDLFSRVKRFRKTINGIKFSVNATRLLMKNECGKNEISKIEKFRFAINNIFPFFSQRKVYSFIFFILWIVYE